MSVATLLGAPRARPLFHRAICQSGAADHVIEPEEAERVAATLLRKLGGPPPSHASLGKIPIEALLEAQRAVMAELTDWNTLMAFLPSVDGDVVPEQPLDAIRRGACAQIPSPARRSRSGSCSGWSIRASAASTRWTSRAG
jgi:carboxylesterase type B